MAGTSESHTVEDIKTKSNLAQRSYLVKENGRGGSIIGKLVCM